MFKTFLTGLLLISGVLSGAAQALASDGGRWTCDGKFGLCRYLDGTGKEIIPARFEQAMPFSEGLAAVQLNGLYGFVDESGKLVIEPRFDLAGPFFRGLAEVFVDDKKIITVWQKMNNNSSFGLPKTDGKQIALPQLGEGQYLIGALANTSQFAQGPHLVGAIDKSGKLVVPLKTLRLVYWVNGRTTWLTSNGEVRPEPPEPIRDRRPPPDKLDCGHGLRLAERNGLWGISDEDGTDVVPRRYRALFCFREGIAWAAIDERRSWCAIGPDGAVRDKPACRTSFYQWNLSHLDPEYFHSDPYENSALWASAFLKFHAGHREQPPQIMQRRRGGGGSRF